MSKFTATVRVKVRIHVIRIGLLNDVIWKKAKQYSPT